MGSYAEVPNCYRNYLKFSIAKRWVFEQVFNVMEIILHGRSGFCCSAFNVWSIFDFIVFFLDSLFSRSLWRLKSNWSLGNHFLLAVDYPWTKKCSIENTLSDEFERALIHARIGFSVISRDCQDSPSAELCVHLNLFVPREVVFKKL